MTLIADRDTVEDPSIRCALCMQVNLAEKYAALPSWRAALTRICCRLDLPVPASSECFPISGGPSVVFCISDDIILKFYSKEPPVSPTFGRRLLRLKADFTRNVLHAMAVDDLQCTRSDHTGCISTNFAGLRIALPFCIEVMMILFSVLLLIMTSG